MSDEENRELENLVGSQSAEMMFISLIAKGLLDLANLPTIAPGQREFSPPKVADLLLKTLIEPPDDIQSPLAILPPSEKQKFRVFQKALLVAFARHQMRPNPDASVH